jgi:5-methylcytosine-specific restriction endonuclease McrA
VREKSRAKLSYNETRELASLPKEIEALLMEKLERWEGLEGKGLCGVGLACFECIAIAEDQVNSTNCRQLQRSYRQWLDRVARNLREALEPALRDKALTKLTEKPQRSGTFGWATSLARLHGRGGRRFEIWLDYYANIGRPTLCLCFRSPSWDQIRAASSFARATRSIQTTDIVKAIGANYILGRPLPASAFERPISEHYVDESYLSVYFRDRVAPHHGASKDLEKRLRDRLLQIVRAAASEYGKDVGSRPYPQAENRKKVAIHMRRERSSGLADQAKRRDGYVCQVCSFQFAEEYGELGRGFAEAHHKVWLSKLTRTTKTWPEDLVTVCANCHRMLHHMKGRPSDVKRLRHIMNARRGRH